ncbi:MAG: LCP family protein [Eubacteriales bacterium]|nr:LCP family protein [Eubacteriales bacterium]MDD3880633.1 LCP family protein [Eubacteriales bacterium]MDD4513539.1 LCP family protein [Eubacteriales bacterium]
MAGGFRRYGGHDSKALKKLLLSLALIAVLIVGAVIAVKLLDSGKYTGEPTGDLSARFTTPRVVNYDGKQYAYNENLSTYLLIGVDKTTVDEKAQGFRNGGQADFLMLLVADAKQKTITRVQIDRDTMTEITTLGVLGNISGTRRAQICLSHAFGGSEEQSCEFTVDAVQKLFFGINIDGYISLNMDGVPAMCDALGGVSVVLEDDLTMIDPAWTVGASIVLSGENAEKYVRARSDVGDGTNESRMRRQSVFLASMNSALTEKLQKNAKFGETFLDSIKYYLTSDMKKGKIVNEVNKVKSFRYGDIVSIGGEHIIGSDGFVEFHPDEESLQRLALGVFFVPTPD